MRTSAGTARSARARWRALVASAAMAVAATILTGCVASSVSPPAAGPPSSGSPTPPGTAVDSPSPGAVRPASADPCAPDSLAATIEDASFAINERLVVLRVENRSDGPCSLTGRPAVSLSYQGEDLGVTTVDALEGCAAPDVAGYGRRPSEGTDADQSRGAGEKPERPDDPLVLLPGESAVSLVEWRKAQWTDSSGAESVSLTVESAPDQPIHVAPGQCVPDHSVIIRVDHGAEIAASAWSGPRTGPVLDGSAEC